MNNKFSGMMGLARRSGNVAFGYEQVVQMMNSGKLSLVIITDDTSKRTSDRIKRVCEETATHWIEYGDKTVLSQAIGQFNKTVFGIRDKNIAEQLMVYYTEWKNGKG
jgi:ribosomal protein L7Ae-like RNA K-turn-binding protein